MSRLPRWVRESEWDMTVLNGGSPLAHICPVCFAHVPTGNNVDGFAYREQHIRWHEGGKG